MASAISPLVFLTCSSHILHCRKCINLCVTLLNVNKKIVGLEEQWQPYCPLLLTYHCYFLNNLVKQSQS